MKWFDYGAMNSFFRSRGAFALAFIWGLCEATFFFVVPDVFVGLAALFLPFIGIFHGLIAILGTMAGGMLMYKISMAHPGMMTDFLCLIPGINERMVTETYLNLQSSGLGALFSAPWSGVPYKIFAVQAGILQLDLPGFILMTFPSRSLRILFVAIIASVIGMAFKGNIRKHGREWTVSYFIFWAVFYIIYAVIIDRTY